MNYPLTSIKELVGSIIRRSGAKDTSLIPDLHEWIAEGMQLLQTSVSLEKEFATISSRFHKAKWPCDCKEIYAIEYCGCRLPYNNGSRDARAEWYPDSVSSDVLDAVFVSGITKENTPTGNYLYTSEFEKVQQFPWHTTAWYKLDRQYIVTSFDEGDITVFYGKLPTDCEGFFLIPDEGNYKNAMRYWIREALHGRGYGYGDLSELQLHEMFERYQGRAISEITYPSPDEVQATVDASVRLIDKPAIYEQFFTNTGSEGSWI